MTHIQDRIPAGPGSLEPPLWVTIGTLDHAAVGQLRRLLHQCAARTATDVLVDLALLDDSHELTMLALLAEEASRLAQNGSTLTALSPPSRLVTAMATYGIRVIPRGDPPPPRPQGTLTITVGTPRLSRRRIAAPPAWAVPQARTPMPSEPPHHSPEPWPGQARGGADTSTEGPAPAWPGPSMPCIYCREAIRASAFAFTSPAGRLVAAQCPSCQRKVTLGTATWRRWTRMADPLRP